MPLDPNIILRQQPVADPVQNYAKILQLKNLQAQQPLIQQQIQAGQQEAQSKGLQIQQQQQALNSQKALDDAMKGAITTNPDGTPSFNREAVTNHLTQAGYGHLVPGVIKQLGDSEKSFVDLAKAKNDVAEGQQKIAGLQTDALGSLGLSVKAANYDPQAAVAAVAFALAHKSIDQQTALGITQKIQANPTPDNVKTLVEPLIAASPKAQESLKNQAQAGNFAATANKTTQLLPGQLTNQGLQATELQQKTTGTVPTTQYQNAELGVRKQEIGIQAARLAIDKQASEAGANITPEAKEQAAQYYEKTGTLPPLGMGKAGIGTRVAIMNRGAEIAPGADIGSNKASYGADKTSLTALQKQRDAVGAFENTASKNLDLFINSASKIVDSGSPILNLPLRMISDKLAGSANIAAVNAARQVANNEIAKVTTNPTLSGTLSDSARHEVEAYNPQTATFKQTLAVANILRADMTNRRVSLDNGIKEIKGRLGGGTTPAAGGEQKATHRFNPATGKIEAIQ
jgi:hypothetical protein